MYRDGRVEPVPMCAIARTTARRNERAVGSSSEPRVLLTYTVLNGGSTPPPSWERGGVDRIWGSNPPPSFPIYILSSLSLFQLCIPLSLTGNYLFIFNKKLCGLKLGVIKLYYVVVNML